MNKRKVIISAAILSVIGISGTVFAATQSKPAEAGDKPPIVIMVENHEERITGLEGKTDDIQTQVNQNSSDIKASNPNKPTSGQSETKVERVVTVVEKPAPLKEEDYPVTPANPAPEPEPVIDPWQVTRLYESYPANATYPDRVNMQCKYIFHNGQTGWSINTLVKGSTLTCAENFRTSPGHVMAQVMRNALRFDQAPF